MKVTAIKPPGPPGRLPALGNGGNRLYLKDAAFQGKVTWIFKFFRRQPPVTTW